MSANILTLEGFAWIGNNSQEDREGGSPTMIMIRPNGEGFNTTIGEIDVGGVTRLVAGSSLMETEIGDETLDSLNQQVNNSSIGWIRFNQGLPINNCFDNSDCHRLRWNKKIDVDNDYEGYFSGWAKVDMGLDGSGAEYPSVWIHFKSPFNPDNYLCSDESIQRDENYYVCIDNTGNFHGYAWSSGADSISIDDNPGLGWIGFSNMYIVISQNSIVEPVVETIKDTKQCSITRESIDKENACEFKTDVTYKAEWSENINPQIFEWKCQESEVFIEEEQTKICTYEKPGIYTSSLKITDSEGEITDCAPITINLTEERCQVEVREAGSFDNYSKDLTIYLYGNIEARISGVEKNCIEKETVWKAEDLNILSSNKYSLEAATVKTTATKIEAQITKTNGKIMECGEADVRVAEKVRWGI